MQTSNQLQDDVMIIGRLAPIRSSFQVTDIRNYGRLQESMKSTNNKMQYIYKLVSSNSLTQAHYH